MPSQTSHGDNKQSAALDKLVRRRQNEDWSRGARVLRRPFATSEQIDEIARRIRNG